MPRNGAGTYTLPEPAFVTGTVIDPSPVNNDFNDIAQALTASLAADGQTPMTGDLDMNGNDIQTLAGLNATSLTVSGKLSVTGTSTLTGLVTTGGGVAVRAAQRRASGGGGTEFVGQPSKKYARAARSFSRQNWRGRRP